HQVHPLMMWPPDVHSTLPLLPARLSAAGILSCPVTDSSNNYRQASDWRVSIRSLVVFLDRMRCCVQHQPVVSACGTRLSMLPILLLRLLVRLLLRNSYC